MTRALPTLLLSSALLATLTATVAVAAATSSSSSASTGAMTHDSALAAAVDGSWRSAEAKARDKYRHPVESLTFWGLKPGMTVLEIQPGAGWWTDVLAPYVRMTHGQYYVTAADLANPKLSDASRKARADFESKYGARRDVYGDVHFVNWGAVSKTLPPEKFDFILTARSIHNWLAQGPNVVPETFAEFYQALKHGGILAVEQHRANPTNGGAEKPDTGYVSEAYVIEQAQKAGFKLAARSEINANPKDTKDHPYGVWTLPPSLRSSPEGDDDKADPNFDHSKYLAIGESDRMTLRFVKP